MNRWRYRLKFALFQLPLRVADALDNRQHCRAEPRILVTRHSAKRAYMFRDFLAWIDREVPQLRSRLEFHRLPCRIRDWSPYALHVSWVADTIDLWSPRGFRHAARLADQCRSQGIPTINPVTCVANSEKTRGAQLMRSTGVRTPRCIPITNPARFRADLGGLELPLLIRDDRGHGRPAVMIESEAALDRIDWKQYHRPIAAEFIDTRDPGDGLFRKYRYVAAGDVGVGRHMIVNDHWEVRPNRRVMNAALEEEELAYINAPDPRHAILQRARRALGLDVAGFDYSLDRNGQVIVWEANPFLDLNYPKNPFSRHIFSAVEHSFAVVARLYLARAGVPIPARVRDLLGPVLHTPDLETNHLPPLARAA